MKKSKVGTWLFVIIVWLILAGIVSFGGFILINVNYQITLEDEIWTIENEMSDEYVDEYFLNERFNTIVSDGNYKDVEKAIKTYLKEYYNTYKSIRTIYENDKITSILSYENMLIDGPNFETSIPYIEKVINKLNNLKETEEKLYNRDYYMNFYEGKDSFYKEYYEEQIKDYLANQKSIKEDMEEVIKIIELEKEILVFLKDNQNSWSLQNQNIYFTDQNVEREYYLLINKFSESEESVDLWRNF